MRVSLVFALALVAAILARPGIAAAEADGPDAWDVAGVRMDDVLVMHSEASARSKTVIGIPADAKGLRNLGCTGLPSFQQWQGMTEAERVRAARSRWCKVDDEGKVGWVAGRYLKEGSLPAPQQRSNAKPRPVVIGAWRLVCGATCALEQVGVGTSKRTVLRIERREGTNAQISLVRNGIARSGTLAVYMDGETITQGPIAPLATTGPGRLVMTPDDITAGLLKRMSRHKNMVLSFPGEERGVEIHLDGFDEAWAELGRRS